MNNQLSTKPVYIGHAILALMALLSRDRGDTCPRYQLMAKPKAQHGSQPANPVVQAPPANPGFVPPTQQSRPGHCSICQKRRKTLFMIIREDFRVAKAQVCLDCFTDVLLETDCEVKSVSREEYEKMEELW